MKLGVAMALVWALPFALAGSAQSEPPTELLTFSVGEPLVAPKGLCIARADGTRGRRLVKGSHDDRESEWSPGGKYVAFVRFRADPAPGAISGIYLANARGRILRNLTRAIRRAQGFNVHPSWSPDGRRIAFETSWRGSAIDVVDRLGRRLTRMGISGEDPQWAPNGKAIVFTRDFHFPPYYNVYSSDLSGANERLLLEGAHEPALSRSGSRIAFIRGLELWVADSDGTNAKPLVTSTTALLGNPEWSPDGRRIAFDRAATINSSLKSVVVVDATTGDELAVVRRPGGAYAPSWRPAVTLPRATRGRC